MRWLTLIAVIFGMLVGLFLPSVGTVFGGTGKYYSASMVPPSGTSGQSPVLTCGWHTGACDSPTETGISLDWDNTATTLNVYFRGYFTRSSSGTETTRLEAQPLENQKGSAVCDIMDVWVIENYNGQLRAIPRYEHINLSSTAQFSVTTSGTGSYNNRNIGYMINDSGCASIGTHVHEMHVPDEVWDTTPNVSETIHGGSFYPNGDYCLYNDANDSQPPYCRAFANSTSSNWTRLFTWEEGS